MRRYVLLLIFVLSFCFAATAQARKLALLVGVNDYGKLTPLKCCVNDMITLKNALMNIDFDENDIFLLVSGAEYRNLPNKENIEEKLSEILSMAQPDDMVFLAFSGHGAQNGETVYFCPADTKLNDLDGTCVSITKVMDDLAKCKAKFKLVIVDACRNNIAPTRDARGLVVVPAPPAGIALFQSCAAGERSFEERNGFNGYFTKNFAAALSGKADANKDGNLTLMEVCTWTTKQTKNEVLEAEHETQTPYFSGTVSDFTISENIHQKLAEELAAKAKKAMDEDNYEQAIELFNKAIELCPSNDDWIRERNLAQKFLDQKIERDRQEEERRRKIEEARRQKEEEERRRREEEERRRKEEAAKHDLSIPGKFAGERKTLPVNGVEFAFCYCPPDSFMMGSPRGESGRDNDETQHLVTLTRGFWIMETEVTVGMFREFVIDTGYSSDGNTPAGWNGRLMKRDYSYSWRNPGFSQGDNYPVVCVSWYDAVEFCRWLSRMTGYNVQLPTEAQWEYACRAGTTGAFAGNVHEMAWFNGNNGSHPVGLKEPNRWGLYDMHGNVCEWCRDWYGEYPSRNVTDPDGPSGGSGRISRNGGWFGGANDCRSADRYNLDPGERRGDIGFRCIIRY